MVGAMALRQLGGLSRRAVLGQNMLRISLSSSNSTSSRFMPVRSFNYSAPLARGKLGPLPSFEPTNNAQLDKLLNFLHEEVFVPPHLLKHHRELIFRPKHEALLKEEPIYFNVDNQSIQLKPTNPSPAANRKTLTDAVKLMKSPFDYNAVPGLVMGFAQAKMPLFTHNLEMIVRRLSLAGRIELLLRMLDQSEYNQVRLNRKALREALRGFVAQNNHSDKIVALTALRRANRLHKYSNNPHAIVSDVDVMRESSGDPPINPEYEQLAPRLYTDPQVTGLLAGMHASTSTRFNANGLDYKGNTAHLIKKFFEFYPAIECELNTPLVLTAKKVFTWRRAEVEYAMLLDALRKAESVLRTTANELLNNPSSEAVATVFQDGVAPPKDQVQAKYKEYNDLASTLRAKIAEIEQTTGKWTATLNGGEKGAAYANKQRTLGPHVYLGEVTETFAQYLKERSATQAEEEAREEAAAEEDMQEEK